jgi:hypothetical protein
LRFSLVHERVSLDELNAENLLVSDLEGANETAWVSAMWDEVDQVFHVVVWLRGCVVSESEGGADPSAEARSPRAAFREVEAVLPVAAFEPLQELVLRAWGVA